MQSARQHGIRIMGPNCLGLIRPAKQMNITFGNNNASPGNLALVSQSGAICTAILDWAESNDIGFSAVVSTGISADLDFGDYLDFLVSDHQTSSILLYIEGIHDSRRFIANWDASYTGGSDPEAIKRWKWRNCSGVPCNDCFQLKELAEARARQLGSHAPSQRRLGHSPGTPKL